MLAALLHHALGSIRVGSLHAEEICYPIHLGLRDFDHGATLYDIGFAVMAGADRWQTADFTWKALKSDADGLRALEVTGADRKRYLLLANFEAEDVDFEFDVDPGLEAVSLTGGGSLIADAKGRLRGVCGKSSAGLFCFAGG